MNESKTPNLPNNAGESVAPQQPSTNGGNRTPEQPPIIPNIPPSPPKDNNADRRKDHTPPWKKLVEIGALVIAFGLLIVNIVQMRSTRKAADAARSAADTANQSLRLDERAWIGIIPAKDVFMQDGFPIVMVVTITNTGKSPGNNVTGDFIFRLIEPNEVPEFIYEHRHRFHLPPILVMPNTNAQVNVSAVVGEEGKDGKPHPPIICTAEIRNKVLTGKLVVAMYAQISYSDVFRVSHWIHSCTLGGVKSGTEVHSIILRNAAADVCDQYNDTDQNNK